MAECGSMRYRTLRQCPVAGHTNTYHTYALSDALNGIERAQLRWVELSAVPGWTEHVNLDRDRPAEVRQQLDSHELTASSLSAHSDLTTPAGVRHAQKAIAWAAEYGLGIVNTAIGGHASEGESEAVFLDNIGPLADAADAAGVVIALETHGDVMATGKKSLALMQKISRASVRVNYDTANVMFYGGVEPVDDLREVMPFVAHVHLKDTGGGRGDWDFPALGSGTIDFGRVLRILDEAGFEGPLSIELEFHGEPWPSVSEIDCDMGRSRRHLEMLGVL
jgi:sugar phosphate isomerase/epimerase